MDLSACWFSIGVATGPVHRFETAQGTPDYVGSTADLAQRLCQAANAQAIWVDLKTIEEPASARCSARWERLRAAEAVTCATPTPPPTINGDQWRAAAWRQLKGDVPSRRRCKARVPV